MDQRQRTVFTWLHVSDIHAGHGSTSNRWDQRLVLQALTRDAEGAQRRGVPAPDAIFVTGDVGYSGGVLIPPGSDGEYAIARRWLHELAAAVGVTPARIFLVPGNHDVARVALGKNRALFRLIDRLRSGAEALDDALADPDDRSLIENRLHGYRELANGFAEGCGQLYWAHPFITLAGQAIRVIGFNTALLANDDLDHGRLWLGKEQLARALAPGKIGPDELVIALAHHPFSWLADHRDAITWVRAHAHLLLCGHVHTAESMQLRFGGGSDFVQIVAGASHTDAGDPSGHGYNFASIAADASGTLSVRVWPRAWSEPNRTFRLDVANVADGTSSAEHPLRPRLAATLRAALEVPLAGAERAPVSAHGTLNDGAVPGISTRTAPYVAVDNTAESLPSEDKEATKGLEASKVSAPGPATLPSLASALPTTQAPLRKDETTPTRLKSRRSRWRLAWLSGIMALALGASGYKFHQCGHESTPVTSSPVPYDSGAAVPADAASNNNTTNDAHLTENAASTPDAGALIKPTRRSPPKPKLGPGAPSKTLTSPLPAPKASCEIECGIRDRTKCRIDQDQCNKQGGGNPKCYCECVEHILGECVNEKEICICSR